MTDQQIIALVARATDLVIRSLAPAGAVAHVREDLIRRQLAAAVAAAAPEPSPEPMSEMERQAHQSSAARQLQALRLGHDVDLVALTEDGTPRPASERVPQSPPAC